MKEAELLDKVAEILRSHCSVLKEVRRDSRLAEDLGLDSVGLLTLAVEVENLYRLQLGESPEHPPRTVADVLELLRARLGERGIEVTE